MHLHVCIPLLVCYTNIETVVEGRESVTENIHILTVYLLVAIEVLEAIVTNVHLCSIDTSAHSCLVSIKFLLVADNTICSIAVERTYSLTLHADRVVAPVITVCRTYCTCV